MHRRYPLQPQLPRHSDQYATDALLGICIDRGYLSYQFTSQMAALRGTLAKDARNATSWEPISVGEVPLGELEGASIDFIYVLDGRRQDSFHAPESFTNHASATLESGEGSPGLHHALDPGRRTLKHCARR